MKNSDSASKKIFELVLFAMLGALMFASDIAMEALPNVHIVGVLAIAYTATFRAKALIPIYIYVFITGLVYGFAFWWVAYLYVWLILWGMAMLIPRSAPKALCAVLYPTICALHGLLFGVLNAPLYAIAYGMGFDGMIAWIASGLGFDIIHMIGNLGFGLLILPLSELMTGILKKTRFYR